MKILKSAPETVINLARKLELLGAICVVYDNFVLADYNKGGNKKYQTLHIVKDCKSIPLELFERLSGDVTLTGNGKIEDLNFIDNEDITKLTLDIDANKIRMLNGMFEGSSIKELIIKRFDISSVKSISGLFSDLYNLINIDIKNLDTSNVENMSNLFYSCYSLHNIDVSSLNTSNTTIMEGMFSCCNQLKHIKGLENFDVRKVTNMREMFFNCPELLELNLENFVTENLLYMHGMFAECNHLGNIKFNKFDTRKVTSMFQVFHCCNALKELDLSSFDTSNVENMSYMFDACGNLNNIIGLDKFSTAKLQTSKYMFRGCRKLSTHINVQRLRCVEDGSMW